MRVLTLLLPMILSACVVVPVPVALPGDAGAARPLRALAASAPVSPRFDAQLNALRRQAGVGAIAPNAGLDRVAAEHAAWLASTGRLQHRGASGQRASGRVRAAGVSSCPAGENLAEGYGSAEGAFAGWAQSPGHRANMTHPDYVNYGLGRSGDVWVLVLLMAC